MKYLLLVLGLSVGTTAMTQTNFFNFYLVGGGNYTNLKVVKTTNIETVKPGYGWQFGGGTQYNTHFGFFVYFNGLLTQESFERDSLSSAYPDTVQKHKYDPLYVAIPFGAGYQFPLNKNLSLKFYGGFNMQVGVAGKYKRESLYYAYDSSISDLVLTSHTSETRNLTYGRVNNKKFSYDLATTNWGAQLGAGINFKNFFEVDASYHFGLSNPLPNRDRSYEINRLNILNVSLKYFFPSDYMSEKTKRRKGY